MALSDAYLMSAKNVEKFFNSLQAGQAPAKFNVKFLEQIGFSSSNDRLFIGLLKSLGFLNDTGAPTKRYFDFLDASKSRQIMANALKEAYSDLFVINKKAYDLKRPELKGKLKSLTEGKKSDKIIELIAMTFEALCKYADWKSSDLVLQSENKNIDLKTEEKEIVSDTTIAKKVSPSLHYNIQIHLPDSRDPKVFDAIFESLKKHIL
jgi:hypothetical protein